MNGTEKSFLTAIITVVTVLSCLSPAYPKAAVIVSEDQEKYQLGLHMVYMEDKTGSLTIEDVASEKYDSEFISSKTIVPTVGFTDSVYWICFQLQNKNRVRTDWVLAVQPPYIDFVDFYHPGRNGQFTVKQAGDNRPHGIREISHRHPVFKVSLTPLSEQKFYLRIKTTGVVSFDMTLWSPEAFQSKASRTEIFLGFFMGALCIMGAYNFFLFLSLKDRAYLYYMLLLFSFVLHFGTMEFGLTYQYLWPNQIVFNHIATILFPLLVMIFALNFAMTFLQTKVYTPILHRFLFVLQFSFLLFVSMVIFGLNIWIARIASIVTLFSILLLVLAGIQAWRNGYGAARFYILAWGMIWLNGFFFVAHMLRLIDFPNHIVYAPFSIMGMMLFLSLALADRINGLKKEAESSKVRTEEMNLQLKQNQKQLTISEKKYRSLFEESKDVIFITDLDGNIEDLSPACEAVFGYTRDQALKLNPSGIFNNAEDCRRLKEIILKEGDVKNFEASMNRVDNRKVDTLVNASSRHADDGKVIGFQGIVRDITAHKQAELERMKALEFKAAKESAENANQAKSIFLANMSHELKTPLHGILGFAQQLKKDDTLTVNQHQHANIILRNGKHLLSLLNDILDFTKFESDRIELKTGHFALPSMLSQITDMIRLSAEKKGIRFVLDMPSSIPEIVLGDQKRLRQILIKILQNAVKFTDRGEINFQLKISEKQGLNRSSGKPISTSQDVEINTSLQMFHFKIKDTGIGITNEQIESIFQPFQQADPYKLQEGSFGLSLALSQRLAMLMNSYIQVESTVGQGSTFWFDIELPAQNYPLADKAKEQYGIDKEFEFNEQKLKNDLKQLPDDLIDQIKKAATRGDYMMLSNMVLQVQKYNKTIAVSLNQKIENFEYDEILSLIL